MLPKVSNTIDDLLIILLQRRQNHGFILKQVRKGGFCTVEFSTRNGMCRDETFNPLTQIGTGSMDYVLFGAANIRNDGMAFR